MRRLAPTRARRRSLAGDDSGAAAVEFALVVPLLLLIVFGIINFGVLFSQQVSINNAVREGARRAVVGDPSAPRTCDGILASVRNELSGLALNPADVQIKVTQDWGTGSDSNGCGSAFVLASFGANAGKVPCKGSYDATTNTARSLIVEAKLVSTIPVSFPPFPTTITLTSKAVYRCEFSV
ncbi:TadE/TadG family type IV pilus assembly protein [Longivirga aurantiaca]|uniref:TadE/TadG family type IV pilus assembly protein n=1 Tax=Longivirga aurantiaca TaxID=1837743 RepID=A0ABW1T408_9ACTN